MAVVKRLAAVGLRVMVLASFGGNSPLALIRLCWVYRLALSCESLGWACII
jgi:hypothetical protein